MNLDAYTIRKIAPRLLFAVIGVNISIYLCVAAIDITNVVGHGLAQLIKTPFNVGGVEGMIDQGAGNVAGVGLIIGLITGGSLLISGGFLSTIGFLMLPIFVIVVLALITIAVRQVLLVLLTLVSPVAIVLAVLPGTERFFKQWWQLFLSTLIVYPIIAALFAISDVMVAVSMDLSNTASNEAGAVNIIAGLLFAFMPIALVPFAFKASGGLMAAVGNMTDGLRNSANKLAAGGLRSNLGKGFQHARQNHLFPTEKKSGALHRINRGAARVANLDSLGMNHPRRWRSQLNKRLATNDMANVREKVAKLAEAQDTKDFDDELLALVHGKDEKGVREFLRHHSPTRFNSDYGHEVMGPDGKPMTQVVDPDTGRREYVRTPLSAEEKKVREEGLNRAVEQVMSLRKEGGEAALAWAGSTLPGISTSFDGYDQVIDVNTGETLKDELQRDLHWDEALHGNNANLVKGEFITSQRQAQDMIWEAAEHDVQKQKQITGLAIGVAKQAGRPDLFPSASVALDAGQATASGDHLEARIAASEKTIYRRGDPSMWTGHPRAAKDASRMNMRELDEVIAQGGADMGENKEILNILASIEASKQAAGTNMKPDSRAFYHALLDYKPGGGDKTVKQLYEEAESNPELKDQLEKTIKIYSTYKGQPFPEGPGVPEPPPDTGVPGT